MSNQGARDKFLWMPAKYGMSTPRDRDPRLAQVHVVAGYSACFGEERTFDDAAALVRGVDFEQLADYVCRITTLLNGATGTLDIRTQARIAGNLWTRDVVSRLATALARLDAQRDNKTPAALFHERQLLNVLKLGALAGAMGGTRVSPDTLGNVTLILNDVLDKPLEALDPSNAEDLERLYMYFFANQLSSDNRHDLAELGRAFYFYHEKHADIPHAFDADAALLKATGMDAQRYRALSLAIYYVFWSVGPEEAAQGLHVRSIDSMLTPESHLTRTELEAALDTYSLSAPNFIHACRERYGDSFRPFDLLVVAQRPLLKLSRGYCCPSKFLLRQAASMGIGHRFLDPVRFTRAETDLYLIWRGDVFDKYATELLVRSFGADRVIRGADLRSCGRGKSTCDSAVLYGDDVILFEWKSTLGKYDAKAGESLDAYRAAFQSCIHEGIVQLASTVDLLEQGAFAQLGLPTERVRRVFLVIASLEFGIDSATLERVWRSEVCAALRSRYRCQALQVFDIKDLELVEVAAFAGASLRDLLSDKIAAPSTASLPFLTYCVERRVSWRNEIAPSLRALGKRAFDTACHSLFGRPADSLG